MNGMWMKSKSKRLAEKYGTLVAMETNTQSRGQQDHNKKLYLESSTVDAERLQNTKHKAQFSNHQT